MEFLKSLFSLIALMKLLFKNCFDQEQEKINFFFTIGKNILQNYKRKVEQIFGMTFLLFIIMLILQIFYHIKKRGIIDSIP